MILGLIIQKTFIIKFHLLMLDYKEIKHRVYREISQLFPQLVNRPSIKKSPLLQALYKVIPCPPIAPKIFKQARQGLDYQSQQQKQASLLSVAQTLKKAEQYFTGCINIIEHNEKVRQRYEIISLTNDQEIERQRKQVTQLIRAADSVSCKSEFGRFVREKGERVLEINGDSKKRQSLMSMKNLKQVTQPGQFYLPAHPDQFSFIARIQQDQYLVYHEEVLQKLLVWLTSLSRLNQRLQSNMVKQIPQNTIGQIRQILMQLSVDDMFCVQDNRFNQLVKYVLDYVHSIVDLAKSNNQKLESKKNDIKEAFHRQYYIQFMAESELNAINVHMQKVITENKVVLQHLEGQRTLEDNKIIHQINTKKILKQLEDFSKLKEQVQVIFRYLCEKQQKHFHLLYQRKIKKAILRVQQTSNLLFLSKKINKKIIQLSELNSHSMNSNFNTPRQSQNQKSLKSQNTSKVNLVKKELQKFIQNLQCVNNEVQIFPKHSEKDHLEIIVSSFTKIYRQIQQLQLKFSQITQKKTRMQPQQAEEDWQKSKKILKQKILSIESQLVDRFKAINNNGQLLLLPNRQNGSMMMADDDKQSIISGVSCKSSIFQPYRIVQSDVILPKISLTAVNKNYLPNMNVEELVKTANDFITNQFLKNELLIEQMEDAKNVNFEMLSCLIFQLENNLTPIAQNNIKPVQKQSPSKQKPKESQSPQNNSRKEKLSRQRSPRKSPKKEPIKKQVSPSKQQQPIKNDQNKIKQNISDLRYKLIFIRQILCPQISQCRVSKIFQQTLHIKIFEKFCDIIASYKQKLFTEEVYYQAEKLGFSKFIQQRVSFVNTLMKNQKQLIEIFRFIRVFSQSKVKFEATDEKTFDVILKALLASKEIQAYRKENSDLAKTNKISSFAVRFLDEQVYVPFIIMFKNLLKIVSSEYSVVKELQQMLENIRNCISLKSSVKEMIERQSSQKDSIQKITGKIQKIIGDFSTLRRFAIFRYFRLDSIIRVLRSSLSLKPLSQSQDRDLQILNYLKTQLLYPQKGKLQPLLT